jgi:hypothetical protein
MHSGEESVVSILDMNRITDPHIVSELHPYDYVILTLPLLKSPFTFITSPFYDLTLPQLHHYHFFPSETSIKHFVSRFGRIEIRVIKTLSWLQQIGRFGN